MIKACFTEEVPSERGSRPLRACGTRFASHKVAALERIIYLFGAYLGHITTLANDGKVKPTDRQKLNGYMRKWGDSKILIGCAFFHDLLKPCSSLCKMLQADEVCVVSAMEAILKTSKAIERVKTTSFQSLPSVRKVLSRISQGDNGAATTYQGIELSKYKEGLTLVQSHYQEYAQLVVECVRERVKVQTVDLLTHALTIFLTNGWERAETSAFGYPALDSVCAMFVTPLENACVNLSLVQGEWDDMVDYAKSLQGKIIELYGGSCSMALILPGGATSFLLLSCCFAFSIKWPLGTNIFTVEID